MSTPERETQITKEIAMAYRPCGYTNCPNMGEIIRSQFAGTRDEFVCADHYFQAVPVKKAADND